MFYLSPDLLDGLREQVDFGSALEVEGLPPEPVLEQVLPVPEALPGAGLEPAPERPPLCQQAAVLLLQPADDALQLGQLLLAARPDCPELRLQLGGQARRPAALGQPRLQPLHLQLQLASLLGLPAEPVALLLKLHPQFVALLPQLRHYLQVLIIGTANRRLQAGIPFLHLLQLIILVIDLPIGLK
jgi:hypothetical protein